MKSFLELVNEEQSSEKHHVMTFGRMNPPTTGHMKLIDKVHDIAKKHNASHTVVTSHSQDAKKNPLSAEQKIKHLKRYSPHTNFSASSKEHPTFLHHATELHKKGVTHLHMVVGSDRVKEMKEKLHKYNGTHEGALYNFKKVTVHSAGHRDPDAEGTEGMSASKMREHAKNKDHSGFKQGVPSHVADHHAKELMHDVRKGMGIHENVERGMFKAVFVTGGPGSGKDIVIREAIAEARAVEINTIQAFDYIADKQKLSEKSNDYRREAIRTRAPLIINGPADDHERILYIKEELEDLGYETLMVFVNTTNEISQERNNRLSRMMMESVRQDKWLKSQNNKKVFSESFSNYIRINNTSSIENIEEDITYTYKEINQFIDTKCVNENAISWLENNNKLNINEKFNFFLKENKNVKKSNRFTKVVVSSNKNLGDTNSVPPDNRANDPSAGDIKWNANRRTGGYAFRTYTEAQNPTIKVYPEPKESNFSKDKEKSKVKKGFVDSATVNQRLRNVNGIGPEFDTRQQGTVYPMSGLGDVTYREQIDFKNFRNQFKEAIDDPGANDMGLAGVESGSSNKEGMDSYKDPMRNIGITIKKKNKKGAQ
jgi:predicted kinase